MKIEDIASAMDRSTLDNKVVAEVMKMLLDAEEYMRARECLYYLKGVVEASHPELLIQPEINCIMRLLQRRWEDVPCRISDK